MRVPQFPPGHHTSPNRLWVPSVSHIRSRRVGTDREGAISDSHKEQESGDIQGGKGDALQRFPGRWGVREASRNCASWT